MELTPVEDWSQSTLAARHLYGSTEATSSLSALIALERLLARELDESPSAEGAHFQISENRVEQEAELLRQKELSSDLALWVDSYARAGGNRTPYLWTWCHQAAEMTTLSCVSPSCHDEVCDTKFLSIMFLVLLDDIADQGGNAELLEQLVGLTLSDNPSDWRVFTNEEEKYATFSKSVRDEVQRRVERFPRYDEFGDLLRYDYLQLMNTMRYV